MKGGRAQAEKAPQWRANRRTRREGVAVAVVSFAVFTTTACGGASGPGAPITPVAKDGATTHREMDWGAGAPSVNPKYTEEESARLYLCPLILAAVVVAGDSKDNGVPLAKVRAEIAAQSAPGDAKDLANAFTQQTYDDDYTDLVQYAQATNDRCVENVGGVGETRSQRALFCLGRQLTALAGFRLGKHQSMAELSARLSGVPGYSEQALRFGYEGTPPPMEGWLECAESQP